MSVRFAHLHLHSEYSLVDSTIRIKQLVGACVRAGVPAVALTDDSNLFGLVKFYKQCTAAGIKPIAGCDIWVSSPDDPRPGGSPCSARTATATSTCRASSPARGARARALAGHWWTRPG